MYSIHYMEQLIKSSIPNISEAHGILCGLLKNTESQNELFSEWVNLICDLKNQPDMASELLADHSLQQLFSDSAVSLAEEDLSWQLLLPDDDEPIEQRIIELASWCQGYLYGIGISTDKKPNNLDKLSEEFIHDLVEISRVEMDNSLSEEESEAAYIELAEYVRVGVLGV